MWMSLASSKKTSCAFNTFIQLLPSVWSLCGILEGSKNYNSAKTRQRPKIFSKLMSNQPLVHCRQTADLKHNPKSNWGKELTKCKSFGFWAELIFLYSQTMPVFMRQRNMNIVFFGNLNIALLQWIHGMSTGILRSVKGKLRWSVSSEDPRVLDDVLQLNRWDVPYVNNVMCLGVIFDKRMTRRCHNERTVLCGGLVYCWHLNAHFWMGNGF